MAFILAIETSGEICSAALLSAGNVFWYTEFRRLNSHSEVLHPMISEGLTHAGISFSDLDAVAVSSGPGSYTGLRIGVSAAKGICYAADKPLLAVNTLQALARQAQKYTPGFGGSYCAMLDARRMEVYRQIFDSNLSGISEPEPLIVDEESLRPLASPNGLLCIGSGADKCGDLIINAGFTHTSGLYPRAYEVAELAEILYAAGKFEDTAYYVPFYLKDFRPGKPKAV